MNKGSGPSALTQDTEDPVPRGRHQAALLPVRDLPHVTLWASAPPVSHAEHAPLLTMETGGDRRGAAALGALCTRPLPRTDLCPPSRLGRAPCSPACSWVHGAGLGCHGGGGAGDGVTLRSSMPGHWLRGQPHPWGAPLWGSVGPGGAQLVGTAQSTGAGVTQSSLCSPRWQLHPSSLVPGGQEGLPQAEQSSGPPWAQRFSPLDRRFHSGPLPALHSLPAPQAPCPQAPHVPEGPAAAHSSLPVGGMARVQRPGQPGQPGQPPTDKARSLGGVTAPQHPAPSGE